MATSAAADAAGDRGRACRGEGGTITEATLAQVLADRTRRFDKGGEQFYDQISALHKSVRSSNPDAALYWLARMLDGGVDPSYLARRLTRMAVEDVGLADPRALQMAIEAWDTYDRLGSPEGDLALAQVVDLPGQHRQIATPPTSPSTQASDDVREYGTQDVPLHIRNAPTKLMKELGYGKGYQYDHDAEGGIALGQTGFPDAMGERVYYEPVDARHGNQAQGKTRRPARGPREGARRGRRRLKWQPHRRMRSSADELGRIPRGGHRRGHGRVAALGARTLVERRAAAIAAGNAHRQPGRRLLHRPRARLVRAGEGVRRKPAC